VASIATVILSAVIAVFDKRAEADGRRPSDERSTDELTSS
jgi:hypothetical protein